MLGHPGQPVFSDHSPRALVFSGQATDSIPRFFPHPSWHRHHIFFDSPVLFNSHFM
jgi:hypothetical protein